MRHTFTTIVGPRNSNTRRKLCFNVSYKGLKGGTNLTFRAGKINLSVTTEIINKRHKILIMNMWSNMYDTPNITMNNLKIFIRRQPWAGNCRILLFPSLPASQLKDKSKNWVLSLLPKKLHFNKWDKTKALGWPNHLCQMSCLSPASIQANDVAV